MSGVATPAAFPSPPRTLTPKGAASATTASADASESGSRASAYAMGPPASSSTARTSASRAVALASLTKLKGSIGEGPNHSNFSDQSSVRILSKFRNVR